MHPYTGNACQNLKERKSIERMLIHQLPELQLLPTYNNAVDHCLFCLISLRGSALINLCISAFKSREYSIQRKGKHSQMMTLQ